MSKTFADECLERADKSQRELYKICESPQKFIMSIPLQQSTDSDLVLDATIQDVRELANRLKEACRALRHAAALSPFDKYDALADKLEKPMREA